MNELGKLLLLKHGCMENEHLDETSHHDETLHLDQILYLKIATLSLIFSM